MTDLDEYLRLERRPDLLAEVDELRKRLRSAETDHLTTLKLTDCNSPYGCRREPAFKMELERLRTALKDPNHLTEYTEYEREPWHLQTEKP
jgi:hypothetical protein